MKTSKIISVGVIVWIVSGVFGWLTCGWLFNWVYTIPPIIWKNPEAMMNGLNMLGVNIVGLAASIIFAGVFSLLYNGIPGKGVKKGMNYGLLLWLVATLHGVATMPFYMTISTTVIIYWLIQGLVINLINGAIVGALLKKKVD
ncbi:hypothetical protein K8R42_02085 [bacterium]|nr:hypothetical protein [bacterium]